MCMSLLGGIMWLEVLPGLARSLVLKYPVSPLSLTFSLFRCYCCEDEPLCFNKSLMVCDVLPLIHRKPNQRCSQHPDIKHILASFLRNHYFTVHKNINFHQIIIIIIHPFYISDTELQLIPLSLNLHRQGYSNRSQNTEHQTINNHSSHEYIHR